MDSINFVNLKTEKTNTFRRFNSLRTITTLFRLIELLFLFTLLSKFSSQFPFKLTFSGEYFKRGFSTLFSPRFVFIIGNAIVVILFLISSQNSDPDKNNNKISESYREHVEKRENLSKNVEKRENEVVEERKVISRSKSGDLEKVPKKQLRRSTTEMSRASFPVAEEMSGEEFRQRVEDFIARQQRSLREDVMSPFDLASI